ncbi:T9SS type A sorting domain-containing protein [Hymenobacter cellulosivorans]|uniref:T9SS type A sorting domain-containing protein n=1 Tax=Hymenobacter cellulosivorans TaxID=2932249 RepID=A0ABY4F6X6_9BACT|nr:T9SS type A sorting domain-containing protein [Hymenobacter cellulosivorans]UOQ52418.1 T9SS type A sorting domain-containing protein [Hymenobacter cellulosivorans]
MKSTATFLLLTALLTGSLVSQAQSYRLQQGFETVEGQDELLYTRGATDPGVMATGTLGAATTTNTNAAPKASNVFSEGSQALGVVNNTGGGTTTSVLTFNNTVFASGSSSNFFSFRLASYQTNNNGGIDNGSAGVQVSIAYNGSTTFVPTLQINGQANGSVFSYTGTGVASATVNTINPTLATVTSPNDLTGSGQSTALTGTSGYSTANISFGSNITQIQVRITLIANGKTALYIDDVVIGSNRPLPVELTSFSAARQAGAVLLKWATASEKNNDRFEVQRSADGQQYATISTVQGAGTTSQGTSYATRDTEPLSGVSYYRLRQVDRDGTSSFSPVRVVGAVLAMAYPSPTYDVLNLPATMVGTPYRVFNPLGQTLLEGKVPATGAVNVQGLRSGGYFLEVGAGVNRVTQRFARE